MLTAVCRLCGHCGGGPSGVRPQSTAARCRPTSGSAPNTPHSASGWQSSGDIGTLPSPANPGRTGAAPIVVCRPPSSGDGYDRYTQAGALLLSSAAAAVVDGLRNGFGDGAIRANDGVELG